MIKLPPLAAPVRAPLRGGILDAADVFDSPNLGYLAYTSADPTWNCAMEFDVQSGTDCEAAFAFGDKVETGGPEQNGPSPFSVYGLSGCYTVGLDYNAMDGMVRDTYLLRESTGVERYVSEYIAANGDAIGPEYGAVSDIITGIGALEQYAGEVYGAVATLHVPSYFTAQLCKGGVIHKEGDAWFTCLGNKVSIGAGYGLGANGPGDAAPAAGSSFVSVSGEVRLGRGDLRVAKALNTQTNWVSVLTERSYVLYVDCFSAAVAVPQDGGAA